MTRRVFVHRGLGVAAATLPFAHVEAAAALARRVTAGPLTRSRFTPLVGTTFEMSDASGALAARLVRVRDLVPASRPGEENCFSLLFQAVAPVAARVQSVYRFSAPRQPALPLLAVPVGRAGGYYEVVVNNPR
jgi:hypothetical protein